MRRLLALLAFVAVAAALVVVTTPAPRPTEESLVRGTRLVRSSARGIRALDLAVGTRRVRAERRGDEWVVAGGAVGAAGRDALDALCEQLATLRAVDAFRPSSLASVGLDPPLGTIVVTTRHRVERLALGTLNAGGSAAYLRRGDEARVLQVGVYLLGVVERVLDLEVPAQASGAYWPEIG